MAAAAAARRVLKDDEWACSCSYVNQNFRNVCGQCGKSKPRVKGKINQEIGKDAAEKSKGLFSADDWSCSKCGNINWARRNTCNLCNAPKHGEKEARTGYGGGYMDRQEVEYKERRDSDDEFDEFGRKKKRVRVAGPAGDDAADESPSPPPSPPQPEGAVDEPMNEDDAPVAPTISIEEEVVEEKGKEYGAVEMLQSGERAVPSPPPPPPPPLPPPPAEVDADDEDEEDSGDDADLSKYELTFDNGSDASAAVTPVERAPSPTPDKASAPRPTSCSTECVSGTCRRECIARCSCSCSCSGGDCSCSPSSDDAPARSPHGDRHRSRHVASRRAPLSRRRSFRRRSRSRGDRRRR